MYSYSTLFTLLIGITLAGSVKADPDPATVLSKLAIQRRDAARKTYDAVWANYRDRRASAEFLYLWSVRWLESEKQLRDQQPDQVAAFKSHLERMSDLEQLIGKVQRTGQTTIDEVSAAEYYRVEAEVWLLQAREKQKR